MAGVIGVKRSTKNFLKLKTGQSQSTAKRRTHSRSGNPRAESPSPQLPHEAFQQAAWDPRENNLAHLLRQKLEQARKHRSQAEGEEQDYDNITAGDSSFLEPRTHFKDQPVNSSSAQMHMDSTKNSSVLIPQPS